MVRPRRLICQGVIFDQRTTLFNTIRGCYRIDSDALSDKDITEILSAQDFNYFLVFL